MAEESGNKESPKPFNIITEAERVARGETRAEAEADIVVAKAELPHVVDKLVATEREYLRALELANTKESHRLAKPFVERIDAARQARDEALSSLNNSENPQADQTRIRGEYWFQLNSVSRDLLETTVTLAATTELPTNKEEEKGEKLGEWDTIAALTIGKVMPFLVADQRKQLPSGESVPLSVEDQIKAASDTVMGFQLLIGGVNGMLGSLGTEKSREWADRIAKRSYKELREVGIKNDVPDNYKPEG